MTTEVYPVLKAGKYVHFDKDVPAYCRFIPPFTPLRIKEDPGKYSPLVIVEYKLADVGVYKADICFGIEVFDSLIIGKGEVYTVPKRHLVILGGESSIQSIPVKSRIFYPTKHWYEHLSSNHLTPQETIDMHDTAFKMGDIKCYELPDISPDKLDTVNVPRYNIGTYNIAANPINDFKPGDRVRLKTDHGYHYNGKNYTIPEGEIVTLGQPHENMGHYFYLTHPIFPEGMSPLTSIVKIEHVKDDSPAKCNCPPENFMWNGRGCVCGGI